MNAVIDLLKNHRTYRHFDKNHRLSAQEIQEIRNAARQTASWMNGQHFSVIRIADTALRRRFAALFPKNPQLAAASECWLFVMDLYRMKAASQAYGGSFAGAAHTEALITAAADTALAAQNAAVAAESLGYGTCFVGSVRQDAAAVVEMFGLPEYTFPLFALCIGKPTVEMDIKPKLPEAAVFMENAYDTARTAQLLQEYEKTMIDFAEARETLPWREKFSRFYDTPYAPQNSALRKKQGLGE